VCWFTLPPSFEQLHWQVIIIAMPTLTFGCYGYRAPKMQFVLWRIFCHFSKKKKARQHGQGIFEKIVKKIK
jgi:hypothetical protein